MKMTQKQIFIGGLLLNHKEKGLNVYEFIKTYKKDLEKQNIDTQKIQSCQVLTLIVVLWVVKPMKKSFLGIDKK